MRSWAPRPRGSVRGGAHAGRDRRWFGSLETRSCRRPRPRDIQAGRPRARAPRSARVPSEVWLCGATVARETSLLTRRKSHVGEVSSAPRRRAPQGDARTGWRSTTHRCPARLPSDSRSSSTPRSPRTRWWMSSRSSRPRHPPTSSARTRRRIPRGWSPARRRPARSPSSSTSSR